MNVENEFIKKTWIELIGEEEFNKIEIDEDGWLEVNHSDFHFKYNRSIVGDWHGKGYNPLRKGLQETAEKLYVRPKKLNNWKKNNGWIKIESEEDLPKEECHCWVIDKYNGIGSGLWKQAPNEENHKKACEYWIKRVTHYQIISQPQPPLY
jgi:hypothetical protein